jgi:hypothetical protein
VWSYTSTARVCRHGVHRDKVRGISSVKPRGVLAKSNCWFAYSVVNIVFGIEKGLLICEIWVSEDYCLL